MRSELLGAKRLAEHHLVDGRVDDLLEARHVDARLAGVEVDEALQLGEEVVAGVLGPASGRRRLAGDPSAVHVDHLLDSPYADAGEADLGPGSRRLHVDGGGENLARLA